MNDSPQKTWQTVIVIACDLGGILTSFMQWSVWQERWNCQISWLFLFNPVQFILEFLFDTMSFLKQCNMNQWRQKVSNSTQLGRMVSATQMRRATKKWWPVHHDISSGVGRSVVVQSWLVASVQQRSASWDGWFLSCEQWPEKHAVKNIFSPK